MLCHNCRVHSSSRWLIARGFTTETAAHPCLERIKAYRLWPSWYSTCTVVVPWVFQSLQSDWSLYTLTWSLWWSKCLFDEVTRWKCMHSHITWEWQIYLCSYLAFRSQNIRILPSLFTMLLAYRPHIVVLAHLSLFMQDEQRSIFYQTYQFITNNQWISDILFQWYG